MAKSSRSFKALILGSGSAATALVSLIIAAVLSRNFDKGDYATFRQTLLVYEFAAPLLTLGLPAALFYFLPGETSRARAILLENLILLGVMGLLFSFFLAFGGNSLLADRFSNPALEKTLLVFALYPVLFLPASAASACLVVRDKVHWFTIHIVATRLARLGLVLGAIWIFPDSPLAAISAITISSFLTCGSALVLMFRAVPRTGISRPSRHGLTSQLKYAIPLGLAVMLESMALGIDKVLVSILCEPDQFAVFVNGAMEIPFIRMITAATMAVILPEIVAFYKTGKKAEALGLWQRSARKIAVLLLPLGGLLFVAAPELMTLFYSGEYIESSRPFRIYLLLLPARVIFFGVIFQAAGRSDLILKRAVGTLLLNAAVSYPMIKYFGVEGAAWGTVVVFWLYVIPYCLAYCSRLLDTVWFRLMPFRHLGMILLAIVGAMLVASQMRPFLPAGHTLSVAVLVSAGYVVILMPALILLCRSELRQYWQLLLRVLPGNRGRS